mmetsp:Transcript_11898/g.29516  ORF Transcript_11898/g.29516 Transcript_11898/m.29516 type:complete len:109 (+) Transcript_11898:72-398(+)
MATGDIGNVCRCICGEGLQENTTVLVPSANGCKDCTTQVCRDNFKRCAFAESRGGAVSVHCIDRSALTPRLAIASLLIVVFLLVVTALGKERFRALRRVHSLIGHRDA